MNLSKFHPFTALVIGDFMLDLYTIGRVQRISPEAPVPVMEITKQESRPGGAGNVALNLVALGGSVIALGRRGSDGEGETLANRLREKHIDLSGFLVEPAYQTPVKNRLVSDGQQLLRVDRETTTPLPLDLETYLLGELERLIPTVQVVAISDYNKGFLTFALLQKAIAVCRAYKIPVVVDPKGIDFAKYRGATVLKPNMKEAYLAARATSSEPLDRVARILLNTAVAEQLLITRSEAGMSLFNAEGGREDFSVRSKEVKDVTGAGDTVLAVVCAVLANRLDMRTAVQMANLAAGIAVERLGCVQVTLPEIAQRLLESNSSSKIFHEEHFFALKQALQGHPYALFTLQPGPITIALFRNLQRVSQKENRRCVIYVPEGVPGDTFVQMLASLQEVHYILLHEQSVEQLCHALPPIEVC